METKFILHGGFTPHIRQENDSFFSEILKSTSNVCKILLVYFAKEPNRVLKNKEEDIFEFEKCKDKKELYFEVAEEKLFLEQIAKSGIVYLHDGSTKKLLDTLKKFPTLKESFNGKIIAADSAGVNTISAYCYSQSADAVLNGVGIIPFKTICHYTEKLKDKIEELNKIDNKSKLLLLKEYEYKVFII